MKRNDIPKGPLVALLFATMVLVSSQQWAWGDEAPAEVLTASRYVTEIPIPKSSDATWLEFLIPPDMFDGGRWDLNDLRLLDAGNNLVPHAIVVRKDRSLRETVGAKAFNRGVTPEGVAEVTLDLGETPLEHNEVEVQLPGNEYRRRGTLEGSVDGEEWVRMVDKQLLHFHADDVRLEDNRFHYSPSRHRFLRVRVWQDPVVDSEPVAVGELVVRRTVEAKGEPITRDAVLGRREPSRQNGIIGSWWEVDLGGNQVPCQRLNVEVEEDEFVRNYTITPLLQNSNSQEFWVGSVRTTYPPDAPTTTSLVHRFSDDFTPFSAAQGEWRRKAGEPQDPLRAELGYVRAGKLKLFVEESANQPLHVQRVTYTAPACVVVIANSSNLAGPLRAYFGDPAAPAPNYDFARNLPEKLEPAPLRLEASVREENPAYVPPPKPFTERFRWLIHGVLGVVSLVLAGLVALLARRVIARHDAQGIAPEPAAP